MSELLRPKYSESRLRGLRADSRDRLGKVLRAARGTITPTGAASALNESRLDAAKTLARWASQGWLQRVRRGIYVPVSIESERADSAPEDTWLLAESAFSPCFISGWSAAEHWSLTEQVFRSVCVATTRRLRKRKQQVGGATFALHAVQQKQFFGLKTIWRGRTRVQVSDPTRTIVDVLADPELGGGARSVADMLETYLKDKELRHLKQLVLYADQLGNRAVFKRLGFLLERLAPQENETLSACTRRLSTGYAKLDPALPSRRLATKWRLWVPAGW